jgi:hypothetical protein
MAGITGLRQKTALADANGVAPWNGANGIKAQISDITDLLQQCGIRMVPDLAALAMLSGADTHLALVKGVALYGYNPLAPAYLPAANVRSQGGGQWEYLCSTSGAPYARVIGDASSLTFDIPHNFDTLTPSVSVYNTLNGLPYPVSTDYTLAIISANVVRITTTSPWAGNSHTVVVKA